MSWLQVAGGDSCFSLEISTRRLSDISNNKLTCFILTIEQLISGYFTTMTLKTDILFSKIKLLYDTLLVVCWDIFNRRPLDRYSHVHRIQMKYKMALISSVLRIANVWDSMFYTIETKLLIHRSLTLGVTFWKCLVNLALECRCDINFQSICFVKYGPNFDALAETGPGLAGERCSIK